MLQLPSTLAHETRLSIEKGIPESWDNAVLFISGTNADTFCSFSAQSGPEGPISVLGCRTGTGWIANKPERSRHGSRSRTWLSGQDFRDPGAFLCRDTSDLSDRSVDSSRYVSILMPMGKSIVRLCSICM